MRKFINYFLSVIILITIFCSIVIPAMPVKAFSYTNNYISGQFYGDIINYKTFMPTQTGNITSLSFEYYMDFLTDPGELIVSINTVNGTDLGTGVQPTNVILCMESFSSSYMINNSTNMSHEEGEYFGMGTLNVVFSQPAILSANVSYDICLSAPMSTSQNKYSVDATTSQLTPQDEGEGIFSYSKNKYSVDATTSQLTPQDEGEGIFSYSNEVFTIQQLLMECTIVITSVTQSGSICTVTIEYSANVQISYIFAYVSLNNWVTSVNYPISVFSMGGTYAIEIPAFASNITVKLRPAFWATGVSGTGWGQEYVFQVPVITSSQVSVDTLFSSNINTTYATLAGVIQSLNGNLNYTVKGLEISTNNSTWTQISSQSGNWTGVTTYLANNGIFSGLVTGLSPNTLYYYRAFAGNSVTGIAYATSRTFTTLSIEQQTNKPIVQAISINLFGTDVSTGLNALTFNAAVNQSDTPVILQGVQFSVVIPSVTSISLLSGIQYQVGTWNGTYDNSLYQLSTTGDIGVYSIVSNYSILSGATVHWRAYAQNTAGVGFSTDSSYSVGGQTTTVDVTAQNAVVSGNSVTLYGIAQIHNGLALGIPITKYLFSWGETSTGDTNQKQIDVSTSDFNYTQGGLKTNTLYYWRAGVIYNGQTYWSALPASQFTTTGVITVITGVCDITTLPVLSASINSFNGSLRINATNSGLATQIGFYVSYNSDGSNSARLPVSASGSYDVGTYVSLITGIANNALVYYAGFAVNPAGENIGQYLPVQLSATGQNPNPPSGNIVSPLSEKILNIARVQGLDNPLGHYAFLIETMLAILLFFGIIIIIVFAQFKEFNIAVKILLWILLIVEILDVLAFVLTGWLGIWPFIILGCLVIAVLIWGIASIANKGGGGS